MDTNVELPSGSPAVAGDYPDRRGSAAPVLVIPPADVPMSTGSVDTADKKRQKKEAVTLQEVDLSSLAFDFKANIVNAWDLLTLFDLAHPHV